MSKSGNIAKTTITGIQHASHDIADAPHNLTIINIAERGTQTTVTSNATM